MTAIELARKMAEYQQTEEAQRAYTLALGQGNLTPEEEMEAASYIFFSQGEYQVAYTTFVSLYNRGLFREELMDLMTQAFYLPNVEEQVERYQANCQALANYPYCFRQDFPAFEDLPIRFFPYDDQGYLPYRRGEDRFDPYVNVNTPVIDRYFFKDLDNPILAQDVYSQYQLEYLNDNVRKSELVGKENHIYLHYTSWMDFCTHLACLDFTPLLKEEKLVFLFEEEGEQYPIDFQARFGIDYSQYAPQPVGVREVTRLIWHTQLSAHNGGDFFNEIFYGHPNLMSLESVIFQQVMDELVEIKETVRKRTFSNMAVYRQLGQIKHPTDKDFLVAHFLANPEMSGWLDKSSRIAPALFFQPHFHNIIYQMGFTEDQKTAQLFSEQYEAIQNSSIFQEFKYIKTVTPMRRPTTSCAAAMRFAVDTNLGEGRLGGTHKGDYVGDVVVDRITNRSHLRDPRDRLYRDSVLVRFEDGKLNPTATFTALAEFLDIPYTESMTYCSSHKGVNPESMPGNARGFDPAAVYRTYDEFIGQAERTFLEYFWQEEYQAMGYDFHYYKGEPVDEEWVEDKVYHMDVMEGYMLLSIQATIERALKEGDLPFDEMKELAEAKAREVVSGLRKHRLELAKKLMNHPRMVSRDGQPLVMMNRLRLDPELLEQPLYH